MVKYGKFAQKLWNLERPFLDNVLYHKGFKKNLYPAGSRPPSSYASKRGLMQLYNRVETKIPAKGHISRYRKENESSKPLPPGRKPRSDKQMVKMYKAPIPTPKRPKKAPPPPPAPRSSTRKRTMSDAQLAKKIMGSNLKPGTSLRKK